MKVEVEVACGPVKQVFEVELDRDFTLRVFDLEDDEGLQTLLAGLVAGEGVGGLKKRYGFKVRRVRYCTGTPTKPESAEPG